MYKVLIVDDESYIRNGLVHLIDWEASGCVLLGAAVNGADALEQIRAEQPDLVISDVNMDTMGGLELAEALCHNYPQTKCILFTGIYEFNSVYNAIKYNVVDLVLKPTSPARIRQAITKAIQQIEGERQEAGMRLQIQQQNEQNLKLKQAILLSNIVEGNYSFSLREALAGVELELHRFALVTLLLGSGSQAPAFHETEKMVYSYIDQLFEEIPYYCAFTSGPSIHIVLDFKEDTPGAMEQIRGLCSDLNKTIDNLTEYYSTIGISNFYTDPAMLPQAAKEATNASNYALYDTDTSSIVEYASMPAISPDTIQGIREYITRLSDGIEAASMEQATAILRELSSHFTHSKLSLDEIRGACLVVANLCIRSLWDHDCVSDGAFSSNHTYYREILESPHMGELQRLVFQVVKLTIETLSDCASGYRNIIEQVEGYIRKHYASDLSLTKIAARFHISPTYLSRLFKSQKGISLITYIQQVRIDKSKELIAHTDLRTYEIAEQVGICDPVYFSKMFKKFTGMRVRDYRLAHGTQPSPGASGDTRP